MRNGSIYILVVVLLMGVSSCSKTSFRQIEKNPDWRVKYEAAFNYYKKEDYYKAATLFESIVPIVRGLPEGEKVQFYLANCQYFQKLYLLSAEQFKTFYETYGRSSFAEEARYMFAYSKYKASPRSNLDQTSSVDAMVAMQEFLNRYPNSKFKDQAIEVILTSQAKMEQKGFDNAYQYYKMKYYKAAMVAFDNFKKNFPDSEMIEEAEFLAIDAEFKLASQSFLNLQKERYQSVVDHYKEFVDKYPESKFLREAEKMYAESIEKLNKKKNNNS
jgi:outer membrane protein assembly factor BamD